MIGRGVGMKGASKDASKYIDGRTGDSYRAPEYVYMKLAGARAENGQSR